MTTGYRLANEKTLKSGLNAEEVYDIYCEIFTLEEARQKSEALEAAFMIILGGKETNGKLMVEDIEALIAQMWTMAEDSARIVENAVKSIVNVCTQKKGATANG